MLQVPRDSHRDKIVALLGYNDGLKEKMEYSYELQLKKGLTESKMEESIQIASNLSIIICLFIGYFYQINVQYF